MKPIPTINELIEIARREASLFRGPQIVRSISAPLFSAIQERDGEIERLRGLMSEAYDCVESIHGGYKLPLDCKFTIANIASLLDQRNGTTEPEPAKPQPETFETHGEVWTRHTPGDPMPVDGETLPAVLLRSGSIIKNQKASRLKWGVMATNPGQEIIGYRLADDVKPDPYAHLKEAEAQGKVIQQKSMIPVEHWIDCENPSYGFCPEFYRIKPWELPEPETWIDLGPEDVPIGSTFKLPNKPQGVWAAALYVSNDGVYFANDFETWSNLNYDGFLINRSLPLTGKWDPNAWEPCRKKQP